MHLPYSLQLGSISISGDALLSQHEGLVELLQIEGSPGCTIAGLHTNPA